MLAWFDCSFSCFLELASFKEETRQSLNISELTADKQASAHITSPRGPALTPPASPPTHFTPSFLSLAKNTFR